MKYSYTWLQKHIEEPLPSPAELRDIIHTKAFEVEDIEEKRTLPAQVGDTIFDIAVLPDRAHDCLSHYGMAREIAGLCSLTLKEYPHTSLPNTPLDTNVEVHSDVCRRYIAIKIDDVRVGPSPQWLVDALEHSGGRSINNVVDATNYVLFDRGQPVHAFDTDKVDGGIVVRLAHEGEKITTLSHEEKELLPTDLVVADYLGALAIAGVKGGASAEVNEATRSVIVEVANFDPISIRKTSRRLGLITDASKRFENDITPEIAYEAACAVASLIVELTGGRIVGVSDFYPKKPEERTVTITTKDIQRLLGGSIESTQISNVFDRYDYSYTKEGDTFTLTVPHERLDITGAHDIADEVGRVVGYDTIASFPLPFSQANTFSEYDTVRAVKWWLAQNGFREVITYVFRKNGEVFVARGPKDKSALRTNLSDGLKESYELNRRNAPLLAIEQIKLFEIGTVFLTGIEEVRVATVNAGVFEELSLISFIEKYAIQIVPPQLSPLPASSFVMWSLYPYIVRDVAVWCDSVEDQVRLETMIATFAHTECVRAPYIFDRFTKDGKTSVAYRLIFQSFEKTLTEEEVEVHLQTLLDMIAATAGLTLR